MKMLSLITYPHIFPADILQNGAKLMQMGWIID